LLSGQRSQQGAVQFLMLVDMREVKHVGQGFADEVFRVFTASHPGITMRAINTSGVVDAMIRHVSSH